MSLQTALYCSTRLSPVFERQAHWAAQRPGHRVTRRIAGAAANLSKFKKNALVAEAEQRLAG